MENNSNFNNTLINKLPPVVGIPVSCWDNAKMEPTDDEFLPFTDLIAQVVEYWNLRGKFKPDEIELRYVYNLEYRSDH